MSNLSYQGNSITQRDADGYVNATEMAKANNARFDHWMGNDQAKEYLKALQESFSRKVGRMTNWLLCKDLGRTSQHGFIHSLR